jgi:L-alanine-DL-glutamate epimerase-like enolase superfamily enzyme
VAKKACIARIDCAAFTIPTDAPESDGTIEWDRTTLITVEVEAGDKMGLGYTYCHSAAVPLIARTLAPEIHGHDVFHTEELWIAMVRIVRNIGWPGVAACAISAIDIALWDLKAKLLDMPLANLLGPARTRVPVYGSGGFTSYTNEKLSEQLSGWVRDGCAFLKMKVGREPEKDLRRAEAARKAIGEAKLFVDANGGYSRKQALAFANTFADLGVTWFEEPVSSDDLEGLHLIRNRAPVGMDIAAGEYGYTPFYFRRMLEAGAVDVLQADATRCGGVTGFLRAAAICDAQAYHSPAIAGLPSICIQPVPRRGCATWNGSTTTCASNTCCSTAHPRSVTATSSLICPARATAWYSAKLTQKGSGSNHERRTKTVTPCYRAHSQHWPHHARVHCRSGRDN